MSPSRSRKPVAHTRPRSEIITAVVGAVTIVAGTVLLIWLIRPGPSGRPGTGGLLSRQARATLLVVLTTIALAIAIAWVLRGRHRPRRLSRRVAVTITSCVLIGGAVVAGILWPGGLVRHWAPLAKDDTPNTTPATPPPISPSTRKPTATTAPKTAPSTKIPTTTKPTTAPSTLGG